jgi:hypothetical protein
MYRKRRYVSRGRTQVMAARMAPSAAHVSIEGAPERCAEWFHLHALVSIVVRAPAVVWPVPLYTKHHRTYTCVVSGVSTGAEIDTLRFKQARQAPNRWPGYCTLQIGLQQRAIAPRRACRDPRFLWKYFDTRYLVAYVESTRRAVCMA